MKKLTGFAFFMFLFISANGQNCPAVTVTPSGYAVTAGDSLIFFASVTNSGNISPTYNWAISAGSIESGQGTNKIVVNTNGQAGYTITATVDAGGFSRNCPTSQSYTVDILRGAEKIFAADYTTAAALTTALGNFITKTNLADLNIPQTAFIYIYPGTATTAAQLETIRQQFIIEFEKKKILPFQYTIAEGSKKKTASFEIYQVPSGASDPKPSK